MREDTLAKILKKKAAVKEPPKPRAVMQVPEPEQDEEHVSVGLHGVLAATEKLLAINRGLDEPDQRDSYVFKRIWTTADHLADRIRLDAGKVRRSAMYNTAKHKTLKGIYPFAFDPYVTGLIIGDPGKANALSSPLEEINPMHLKEQARRITQMGPGGIGSEDAITSAAQAVHPSQFGFVCSVSGPESSRIGIDARLSHGVKIGTDGRMYQRFRNKRTDKIEYVTPEDLENKTVAFSA